MVEGKRNVSHASTKYWVTVILATSWQCQRFDSESDALAYAQVYARLPNLKRWWPTPTDPFALCAVVSIIATLLMPDHTNKDISQERA
jgi:hypothetical protein